MHAAAGQDDNAVIAIGADGVKQVDELFMGMSIKNQRAAIRCEAPPPARQFANGSVEHWENCRDKRQSGS